MELSLFLVVPIFLTAAWFYTAHISRTSFPQFRNKRICLLIAHPDDEAMFFAPTLLALTRENLGNHVKILCLSNGNADQLGLIREKELLSSALTLGLRSPDDVLVLDSPSFPDSMTVAWDSNDIAAVLSSAFTPNSSSQQSQDRTSKSRVSNAVPTATIDVLITFDSNGISRHPNHISLFHGARTWLSALMANNTAWRCPVDLYTLTTTNIIRKYLGILDAPITMLLGGLQVLTRQSLHGTKRGTPERMLFINDILQWNRGQKAMTSGHRSQMRWFRWGWIVFSRYMVENDLKKEIIS